MLLSLFSVFLKIGAFTFGGGYAMIPLIQKEVVEKKNWVTDEDILDVIAIAESTPGPIAINAATFVGYKVAGIAGAACATLGVVLPSFVIISLISFVLNQFQDNLLVQYAFFGIRAGVLALIIKAWLTMYKQCPRNTYSYLIAALAFISVGILHINAFAVIVACALTGFLSMHLGNRKDGQV